MQSTTNYNLNKPENTDEIKISDLNENFDKIDTELKNVNNEIDGLNENKVSTTGDVSDTIVTEYTTTQTSFPSLSVGEKLKVVFGKINKFISDVKNWKTTVDENLETNTAAIDTLNSDFSRRKMKKEVAKGDFNVETKAKGKQNDALKELIKYQYKTNILQYIIVGIMMLLGIAISFINEDGIGITVGSLVQGDTTVSNITVNLGALLILGSLFILINVVKNSNTNFKEK